MPPDRGQPVYSLKVAAGLVGLSPRTMRLYEEAELLAPARVGGNQQRLYSDQDLQWLSCIRDLIHEDSLTVAAIRRLLDLIPCWEVKHCAPEIAEACKSHLRIPNLAGIDAETAEQTDTEAADTDAADVRIELFYGVQELDSILHCARCVAAERAARKVALNYPDRVSVHKADILSDAAQSLGVIMSPTLLVNGELLTSGTGVRESRLDNYVRQLLVEIDDENGVGVETPPTSASEGVEA